MHGVAGLLRLAARQEMGSTEALTDQAALARCQRTLLRKHPALGALLGQPGSKGTRCFSNEPTRASKCSNCTATTAEKALKVAQGLTILEGSGVFLDASVPFNSVVSIQIQ